MMQTVAALTLLRDDAFSLKAWLRHYGGQFGRGNCYLICAGADPELVEMARGCSIFRLPDDFAGDIGRKRGRILNNFVAALRCYFTHVIVGDTDELVVVDPLVSGNLHAYLATMPDGRVMTPLGLELIHQADRELEPAMDTILGPRSYVRVSSEYSKPCIISTATNLSRNGQFARFNQLFTPDPLYLLNLKNCDRPASPPVFESPVHDGFDFSLTRQRMHSSWQKRGTTGYWNFDLPGDNTPYLLPERFLGMF